MMIRRIQEFIINSQEQWCAYAVLAGIAVLILLGLMFIILRRITYGEMLMSAGFCMGILTLLLCAGNLGLPVLMDPARWQHLLCISADSVNNCAWRWTSVFDFYAADTYDSAKCSFFYLNSIHGCRNDSSGTS